MSSRERRSQAEIDREFCEMLVSAGLLEKVSPEETTEEMSQRISSVFEAQITFLGSEAEGGERGDATEPRGPANSLMSALGVAGAVAATILVASSSLIFAAAAAGWVLYLYGMIWLMERF